MWSVNYLVARWAPGVIAPHALALGRWFLAALLLAVVCRDELIPGAGSYAAYSYMQRKLGVARVGAVLALAVRGERIEWYHGIGALLILPGIWLSTRR